MAPTRRLTAAVKAEVAAELNGLPHGRITDRNGRADVFTAGLDELERWFLALGGHFTPPHPAPDGSGVVMWTLTTDTDHGRGVPVRVWAMALEDDQLDPACADAIRPHSADQPQGVRPGFTDAWGICTTCNGHGSLTTEGEEIPYEELSPRRKQGHDAGRRFRRNTSKPCPDCDGQDRATNAAVSAHEATL